MCVVITFSPISAHEKEREREKNTSDGKLIPQFIAFHYFYDAFVSISERFGRLATLFLLRRCIFAAGAGQIIEWGQPSYPANGIERTDPSRCGDEQHNGRGSARRRKEVEMRNKCDEITLSFAKVDKVFRLINAAIRAKFAPSVSDSAKKCTRTASDTQTVTIYLERELFMGSKQRSLCIYFSLFLFILCASALARHFFPS